MKKQKSFLKITISILLITFLTISVSAEKLSKEQQKQLEKEIEKYVKMLQSENTIERIYAVKKLSKIESNLAIEPLGKTLLFDKDEYIRRKAAFGIGKYKNYKAVNYLIVAIREEKDRYVLKEIILSMGRIDDKKVIPYLEKFLEKADYSLKSLVKKTINKLRN